MKTEGAIFSLILLLFTGHSCAATAICAIQGVWQGRIGQIPVTLEIDQEFGRYRYRESIVDLLLRPRQGESDTWDEYDGRGRQTGSIQLACEGNSASGSWTSPTGKSTPLTAQRIGSYDGNRIRNAPLKVWTQRSLSGRSIQSVSIKGIDDLQVLQIKEASPSEAAINRALRSELDLAVENHLACVNAGHAIGRFEDPFGDTLRMTSALWSGAILSIARVSSGYCGGAHPYHSLSYAVFDTNRGIELSLDGWIRKDQRSTRDPKQVLEESELGRVIWSVALQGRPDVESLPAFDQECLGSLHDLSATIAGIHPKGMGFRYWYPYAQSGCVKDYIVPWNVIGRFLTSEGRHYVEQLNKR